MGGKTSPSGWYILWRVSRKYSSLHSRCSLRSGRTQNVYNVQFERGGDWQCMTTRGPAPFSPVYHGMQFRAAPPEQPARQITALFATPGTSKRNKDLRRCRDAGIYAYPSWTSVRRESGNDNVQLPRKHYARRATSLFVSIPSASLTPSAF